jgi:DNA-binding SARP family transcriptional activator
VIEFRLLGPLEAPVELPGGKPRALLARLLLDAGRIVSADTLAAALWDDPPASSGKLLQAHISALRKALGPDVIETHAPGYTLRAAASDLVRFEELTERAVGERDPANRARLLRDALTLWRGEPLAEFTREPFARPAAARLAELRLDALTRRFDAELELEEPARLVPELQALVQEEPLREQPRRQLMTALYRSGRQADALAVYREGRRLLVEQLGIEPGPALQELERAILRQDAALARTAGPPARGPVVCVDVAPLDLLAPLDREVIVVELASDATSLAAAAERLEGLRAGHPNVRTASFTTRDAAADAVRIATEQEAELLLVRGVTDSLLAGSPCDVAVANAIGALGEGAILVPFGGARDEWPALQLAGWLAQAHGRRIRLLGVEATEGRRDASRTLAGASLVLQRFNGVGTETALVEGGAAGVLAQPGAAIVAALPRASLDATRGALLRDARVPVLLVHGGLRPGGLAPDRTLTRFSWSLA